MLYEYHVSDRSHRIVKGSIDALTTAEAIKILKDKGFLIIKIREKRSFSDKIYLYLGRQKLSLSFSQLVDFTRQMGIMINAGLTLIDSLAIIQKQSSSQSYYTLVGKIQESIKSGSSLSGSLELFPDSFKNFYISLVKAGESSGKLDEVLLRLADNLEKSREFKGKVIGALIYPIIVIVFMAVVAFIMLTFVLPQLLDMYKNFNVELPFTTQIIIAVSNFLRNYWYFVLIGIALLIAYAVYLLRQPKVKMSIDYYVLRLPVFGKIIQQSVLVESTRTLSILLHSGVPLLDGLNIMVNTTDNRVYQRAFRNIVKNVERGTSLGDALASEDIFPDIFVQMTAVGEKTGQLDDTLMRLSSFFQMETELAVKTATTLIEPAILIVLGIGVGFLVVSVLTPIYNLTSSFGSTQ